MRPHLTAMLSVIIQAGEAEGERLAGLLGALTSLALDGLVREVLIAGGGPAEFLKVLREETGAELAGSLTGAIGIARSERLLVLPAEFRPRDGWTLALSQHVRAGGGDAVLPGAGGRLLRPAPYGLLIGRAKARPLVQPDLKRLRRVVGDRADRIGG